MKFFENQKIDEIGILGVKLQKILIFLSIVNLVAFIQFSLFGFIAGLSMQIILGMGLYGSYKRVTPVFRPILIPSRELVC